MEKLRSIKLIIDQHSVDWLIWNIEIWSMYYVYSLRKIFPLPIQFNWLIWSLRVRRSTSKLFVSLWKSASRRAVRSPYHFEEIQTATFSDLGFIFLTSSSWERAICYQDRKEIGEEGNFYTEMVDVGWKDGYYTPREV